MSLVFAIALCLVNLLSLATVPLGLPGNWVMLAATAGYAWWRWDASLPVAQQEISPYVLLAAGLLALAGELVEVFAGAAGSRRAGGSKWGALGALVGTVAGAIGGTVFIPIPVMGTVLGAILGAAGGAAVLELTTGRSTREALRSGAGAGAGRFAGLMAKLGCGAAMWLLLTVAVFW
ncbi:MAG: DUF456 domain-containing protein [Phycisphaerales bacterium]|nr:MAG: DUF456 domain-containing protein [Phycisphaerales bacterium]